ncbi:META domain-containing protein [Aridibaculum aurantiacum]|uniref:META domain-containing protein n=1 Tax=Aridibaculum aurantiacum TaxID=2810307 RepID=UPI001A97769D|nr:META domain-containing protein [Aridibaculum aurantiacum]
MKSLLFTVAFGIFFTTCSTSENNTTSVGAEALDTPTTAINSEQRDTARKPSVLSGEWQLTAMPGHASNWNKVPILHLDVDSAAFYGNTGCNTISGRFLVRGASITFDNEIMTTKMACTGAYKEQVFLDNLLRVNNYSINDTALHLRQLDTVKMIFKRRPI